MGNSVTPSLGFGFVEFQVKSLPLRNVAELFVFVFIFEFGIFFPYFHFAGFAVELQLVFYFAVFECEGFNELFAHGFTLETGTFAKFVLHTIFGGHHT
jgi:hypothetical protein